MPIYEYRCTACGFQKDVLQKIADAPLTVCPSCGKDTFGKLLSAPGFQLAGSGWYATDFKGGSKAPSKPESGGGGSSSSGGDTSGSSASAAGCATSCACH